MKQPVTVPTADVGVVIGRWQIFHNGHYDLLKQASALSRKLIVIIGSANRAISPKNPLTCHEREEMILEACDFLNLEDVEIVCVNDYLYEENRWLQEVQEGVESRIRDWYGNVLEQTVKDEFGNEVPKLTISLFGHLKDDSSYYLRRFPQWQLVDLPGYDPTLHATDVRAEFFRHGITDKLLGMVPASTGDYLKDDMYPDRRQWLEEEFDFLEEYKTKVNTGPYPYIRQTVDAIVTCKGHILLIQRKKAPGQGLWALPGGHLHGNEMLKDAAIRELREEAGSHINPAILHNSLRESQYFDHPDRSQLCRTITTAFHFPLNLGSLPELVAADDAADAEWVPFSKFQSMWDEGQLYEDHGDIASYFIHSTK